MDWFTDRHCFLLAVAIYGASAVYSVFLWRKGFRKDDHVNYFLLLAAFALHTMAMVKRGFSIAHCPVNNLYEATTFVAWTIVAAYLVIGLLPRLRFLGAFASPVLLGIGVFALMPALDPPHGPQPEFSGALVSLHAATILLAYGAFGLGAVASAMFLTQQHDLKFHKLRAVLSLFPSIQRLEIVTVRLVFAGFILLTIGLEAGRYIQRPPDSGLLERPESGLVHFHVAGLSGAAGGAPDAGPVRTRPCRQRHRGVCVSAADFLGNEPAFAVASSMKTLCQVPSVEWRELAKAACNSCFPVTRHPSPVTFSE